MHVDIHKVIEQRTAEQQQMADDIRAALSRDLAALTEDMRRGVAPTPAHTHGHRARELPRPTVPFSDLEPCTLREHVLVIGAALAGLGLMALIGWLSMPGKP